ncbi:MAG: 4-hydroxy-tetrahydrodipicolinate synthase [Clostridia bacterium]|nr:4-hydroxy-tetrahydrodipicolinate synthase [Clostridia bacterium]
MKTPVFTGASVAIVTPFNEDFSVNYEKLADLIELQIAGGTSAITICGTTGEASALDDAEHKECIRFAVEKVAGRIPVIAGTGSNDTAYAIQLSKYAQEVGADALLQVTPYYNKTTQAGLIRHFTAVADSVDIPIILYNVPSRTGMSITADTYKTLSAHPNINGAKEASGNFTLIAQTLSKCGDELNIWSGNDDQAVPVMALGGKGVISVASNIAPRLVADMCKAALSGDFATAGRMQTEYFDFFNDIFCEVNPIPIKAAMNMAGMNVGSLRMPLCEIGADHAELLKKTLTRLNII